MGDEIGGDQGGREALLGHPEEDALWDAIETATPSERDGNGCHSVRELLEARPQQVLRTLERGGVKKLGEFVVPDHLVLGRLGSDSIVTMGSQRADIDFEAEWRRELARTEGGRRERKDEEAGWTSDIPVIAYLVIIRDAAAPDRHGLLQPVLKRWQAGGCSYSAFALPPVQAVIDWKWERFARRLLLAEAAAFILWLTAFYVFVAAFQDEDTTLTLRQMLGTQRGRLAVACDVIALLAMAPFVLIEACTVRDYGVKGWATAWNLLDTATYINQISIVAMHLGRFGLSSEWLSILAALQCIMMLFRLQYFSRVFTPTRFAFLDDIKEVLQDVRWYLAFLMLIVLGYAAAFQVLFRKDQKQHEEFENLGKSFIQMITWAAGNADLQPLYSHAHAPIAACVLGASFVFILGMVLINLLVGIMANSLNRVTENEGLRLLLSKAQAIDELEATIPSWVESRLPWLYPTYLHVLRVDPDRMDSVKKDQFWAGRGDDERQTLLEGASEANGAGDEDANGNGDGGGDGGDGGGGEGGSPGGAAEAQRAAREVALARKLEEVLLEVRGLKELLAGAGIGGLG